MKNLITICLLFTGMVSMAQDTTVTITLFDETFAGNQINYPQYLHPYNPPQDPVIKNGMGRGHCTVEVPLSIQVNRSNIRLQVISDASREGKLFYVAYSAAHYMLRSDTTIRYEDLSPTGAVITTLYADSTSKIKRVKVTYDSTYKKPTKPVDPPTGINENLFADLKMYATGNTLVINNPQELAVTIQNTLGQIILTSLSNGNDRLQIPHTGIYYVTVNNAKGRLTKKLYFGN